jgi:hypothetical protein
MFSSTAMIRCALGNQLTHTQTGETTTEGVFSSSAPAPPPPIESSKSSRKLSASMNNLMSFRKPSQASLHDGNDAVSAALEQPQPPVFVALYFTPQNR